MNQTSRLESEILALAVEDYYGLWELLHQPQARQRPWTMSEITEAVHNLVNRGWVSLYEGSRFDNDHELVPSQDNAAVLYDPTNWRAPDTLWSKQVYVAATPTGEAAYLDSADDGPIDSA